MSLTKEKGGEANKPQLAMAIVIGPAITVMIGRAMIVQSSAWQSP